MSKLRLTGETSGYVELASQSVANNNTIKLPNSGDTLISSDYSGNVNIAGILTATTVNAANVTGEDATFTGNVSIGGTLTYQDVTNIDSVGLITARSGIQVTGGSVVIESGDINVSGVVTATNATIGAATTFTEDLVVQGDARITGILTVGTSIITLDGINNQINVGTGLTLSSSGITAGVITATSFSGDGSELTGISGAASITVLSSNSNLESGNVYMLNVSGLVLTLPASPSTGDAVDILNNVSGIHTIARNGSTIMDLSEDMTLSQQGLKFKIWYTGSTWSLF
jgi:hypothetical protein